MGKGFVFPALAGLACLPCIIPALIVLAGSVGLFLTTGLFVGAIAASLGLIFLVAFMRRRATACAASGAEKGCSE